MKAIAIIPARSGSKGLKDKNIKELLGKPLIAYSIEAAVKSNMFDTIHLSTDSKKYADIGRKFGADIPFLRSDELSGDQSSSWDTVQYVLNEYKKIGKHFDIVVLLQPTSPLRIYQDIVNGFEVMKQNNADSVIGVCECDHSPLWCNTIPENGCLNGFISKEIDSLPRQYIKTYYTVNGALYIIKIKVLENKYFYNEKSFAYVMPKERSIDIDDLLDFKFASVILENNDNS